MKSTQHGGGWFALVLVAAVAAFGAGAAVASEAQKPFTTSSPPQPTEAESLAYYVDTLPYRVAPGDLLDIDFGASFDGKPLRADNVLVRPDGMISLNPIGDVRAAGRTPGELDSVLTGMYVNVFREPNITVSVAKLAGNFVHVLGNVRAPGSFEVTPNATVLQALARAGGPTNEAAMGSVILMRRTGPNSVAVRKVQLNHALKQGMSAEDPYVRRFDIIYVPKTKIASVTQFATQFFGSVQNAAGAFIYGWETFHIDRVFPVSNVEPRP